MSGSMCESMCEDRIAVHGWGYYKVEVLKNGTEDNMWQVGLKYAGN